jgi:hypothetical protein
LAAWLVLDWDHDQFQLLCAQGTRSGVKVTRALSWAHPEPFTPSTADRVGKALRDFLKAQKIAAAPVIVGIGRDRVFLKELRIPPIAAHEEASLVRFQTGKEMAEAVENYAVDYTYLNNSTTERHIMTVAARRDIVVMIQTLCESAGLKLHAITPRLFGIAQVLTRSLAPDVVPLKPDQLNVVLTLGQRWAGLSTFRGDRILQAQALANGPLLAGEVRRSIAVLLAQNSRGAEPPPCLYVFGDDTAILQSLEKGQPLPLRLLDPLNHEPAAAAEAKNPALFAGAVGLAALWSEGGARPVNLSSPKKSVAPTSMSRQRVVLTSAVAAVLFVLVIAGMAFSLSSKRNKIAELTDEKIAAENFLVDHAQERAEADAYRDWEQSTVPWLDEMYEVTYHFPFKQGFRVNQFVASSTGSKKTAKDGYIGKIALIGISPEGSDKDTVYKLQSALTSDGHFRPGIDYVKTKKNVGTDFQMKIDVARQEVAKYTTKFVAPTQPRADAEVTPLDKKNAEPVVPPTEPDDEDGGDQ